MSWFVARAADADALFAAGAVAVEPSGDSFVGHFLFADEAAAAGPSEPCDAPDWASEWLAQQRAALVAPSLFVCSSAAPRDPPAGARRLLLDPSLAFGDGFHATTRLCLREVVRRAEGKRVLDVGCGTGVLSLAALLFGAREACACDLDAVALAACARNAARNRLNRLRVTRALPDGSFDLALANLPEEAHAALAPSIAARLAGDAVLVLSGFAVDRRAKIERLYGLPAIARRERSGWAASILKSPLK